MADLLRKAQEEKARVLMTWLHAGEVACIVELRWGLQRLHAALAVMEATALEIIPVGRELALMAAHIKQSMPSPMPMHSPLHWLSTARQS